MIEYFLQPARVKALLVSIGAALAIIVSLLVACVSLYGKLGTERAGHKTTRLERDNAVAEGVRWKAVAEDAETKQSALRGAADACLDREREAREDAAERDRILRDVVPVIRPQESGPTAANPATAGGKKNEVIVDDATRRKAMDRLNRPL